MLVAAQAMNELDIGCGRLVGMVTDRDIVLRAVAQNMANDDTTLEEPAEPDRSHQSAASGPAGVASSSGIARDDD